MWHNRNISAFVVFPVIAAARIYKLRQKFLRRCSCRPASVSLKRESPQTLQERYLADVAKLWDRVTEKYRVQVCGGISDVFVDRVECC